MLQRLKQNKVQVPTLPPHHLAHKDGQAHTPARATAAVPTCPYNELQKHTHCRCSVVQAAACIVCGRCRQLKPIARGTAPSELLGSSSTPTARHPLHAGHARCKQSYWYKCTLPQRIAHTRASTRRNNEPLTPGFPIIARHCIPCSPWRCKSTAMPQTTARITQEYSRNTAVQSRCLLTAALPVTHCCSAHRR
jgi:ferredoxin-like protein FixX